MQRAVSQSLGVLLLSTATLILLPAACAQGEHGVLAGATSSHASSSGHGTSTGTGGGTGTSGTGGSGGSTGGASAVGAGGSTGSAGASTGGAGGGPMTCDNNPSGCNGCTACAQAGTCASAWAMCMNAPQGLCVTFMTCLNQCGGDTCCINDCNTQYLDGVAPYYMYQQCICGVCMSDCLGQSC